MKMFLELLVIAFFFSSTSAQYAGPFEVHVKEFSLCEDVGSNEMIVDVQSSVKEKDTIHVTGNLILPYGWTDKVVATVKASKFDKTGKRKNTLLNKKVGGSCSALSTLAPVIANAAAEAVGSRSCPIKPGNYTIDTDLTMSVDGVPAFVYGLYLAEVELYLLKPSKKIGCFSLKIDIVPKKSSRRKG